MRLTVILSLAVAAAAAGLVTIALTAATAPSTSVQFTTHLITDKLRGGYSVAIADVNHDGKLDIVPVAAGDVVDVSDAGSSDRRIFKRNQRRRIAATCVDHSDFVHAAPVGDVQVAEGIDRDSVGLVKFRRTGGSIVRLNGAGPIADDGVGFAQSAVAGRGGLGLIGMEERAQLVNGKLSIAARPGHGARIVLEAPLPGGSL